MDMPLAHFETIRQEEIDRVMLSEYGILFKNKDVLEIGSGNGIQLREIAKVANSITGLELKEGAYVRDGQFNIVEYDGEHIPFPDASFDVVFSSNVMEHVPHQQQINDEIRRILRPEGKVVHVMPTRAWRILTSVLHYPRLVKAALVRAQGTPQAAHANGKRQAFSTRLRNILIPARHGELGGWFSEYRYFGITRWAAHFERMGWKLDDYFPVGLAYSGNSLFADHLSIASRAKLSSIFGSSTAVYVLSKTLANK
jgi:SAM-dependent methyltransferase